MRKGLCFHCLRITRSRANMMWRTLSTPSRSTSKYSHKYQPVRFWKTKAIAVRQRRDQDAPDSRTRALAAPVQRTLRQRKWLVVYKDYRNTDAATKSFSKPFLARTQSHWPQISTSSPSLAVRELPDVVVSDDLD